MPDPNRQPDPQTTLLKALAVLAMLLVALGGMAYTGWLLWTLPGNE